MPITKRPTPAASKEHEEALAKFIQGAPDARAHVPAKEVNAPESNDNEEGSVQITLRISKALLDRMTAIAKKQGIPRASYIKRAIALQLMADENEG